MTTPGPDERLSAYFDGELSAAERVELERLLTERSDLRNELNGLADLSLRLNDLAEDLPDFDLRSRVLSQIESTRKAALPLASRTSPIHRRSWMPLFLSVSSLVLLAAVMWPLLPMSDSLPQLAQHHAAEDKLSMPQLGIVKATVSAQEAHSTSSENGLGATSNLSLTEGHATTATLGAVVSADGNGPSVVLAQIEKTRGLKAGEIVSRMVEAGDTPMLAEYTVADVRRSAEDVEVLLKEHGIQPLTPQQTETQDAAQSSSVKLEAASPVRVYLLDAESVSLNTAIYECKSLQEVVATNVDSFSIPPTAEVSTSGNSLSSYPSFINPPTPELTSDTSLYSSPVTAPLDPESPAAKLQQMRNKQEARAAKERRKSQLPPGSPPTLKDEKGNSTIAADLTKSAPTVIAGNSLVVENSVEVYAELQHLMNQPKLASHSSDRAQIVPSEPNRPGVVETRVKDDLNAVSRPESQKMSMNWSNQSLPQQQQQANRNRQRAFLVLRSQTLTQPPEPPQPVPLQPPD